MSHDFAGRLRQLREDAGLTQQQLADKAGLSLPAVKAWERGARAPGLDSIRALAAGLGVTANDLTSGDAAPARGPGRPPKLRPEDVLVPLGPLTFREVPVVGTVGAGPACDEELHGVSAMLPTGYAGDVVGYLVRGRSMADAYILDGYAVFVRREPAAKNKELVVAWVHALDGMVLKRLKRRRDGFGWLESDDGFEHRLTDRDKVYGTYVGHVSGALVVGR